MAPGITLPHSVLMSRSLIPAHADSGLGSQANCIDASLGGTFVLGRQGIFGQFTTGTAKAGSGDGLGTGDGWGAPDAPSVRNMAIKSPRGSTTDTLILAPIASRYCWWLLWGWGWGLGCPGFSICARRGSRQDDGR
jgi:hypothetical protein